MDGSYATRPGHEGGASPEHDQIAFNMLKEIGQKKCNVRFVEGKSNTVADPLSQPGDVPLQSG